MVQEGASIVQEVEIDALSAIWVPVAFEATGLRRADQPLRWDEQSSTLIVESEQRSSDGLRYTAVSQAPTFDPAVLRRAGTTDPDDLAERYEALPSDFPAEVAAQARRLTDGQRTRYDQAIALQDWFREEFDYSLSSPPGHGDDALVAFLDSRVGYCEQFAGAYAAMARSLGIPARVAVGFTPGDPDPEDPQRSIVRGRHAHAWPELYFPGMGWVPFEPTPGRGIPGGETYTGVPEQQAGAGAESPTTSTTTEAEEAPEAPSTTAGSAASTPQRTETDAGAAPTADDPAGAPDRTWVLGLVAAVAAAAVGLAAWVRRRRRLAALAALRPADRAWDEVVRRLGTELGVVVGAAETPGEVASRVGAEHPRLADDLSALADLVTAGRWSEHPDEGIDGQAMAHRDAVVAALATGDRAPAPA
jgi:transglutaminase-like putative cysteine protease